MGIHFGFRIRRFWGFTALRDHRCNETVTTTGNRHHEPVAAGALAQRLADCEDALVDVVVLDYCRRPHALEQLLLRHQVAGMRQKDDKRLHCA
jgi:hypothetical protein